MADLDAFSVDDLVTLSTEVRHLGEDAATMAEAGQRICDHLRANLTSGPDSGPACVYVTVHKTHALRLLPEALREVACSVDDTAAARTPCLVLLSAAPGGVDVVAQEPRARVRPLTERAFRESPLMPRLIEALGVDVGTILDPQQALKMQLQHRNLNVFVERDLPESEWVPDDAERERLRELGLRTVVSIGGILPSGDLFLLTLFAGGDVSDRSADLLRSLGIAVKAALIPHTFRPFREALAER